MVFPLKLGSVMSVNRWHYDSITEKGYKPPGGIGHIMPAIPLQGLFLYNFHNLLPLFHSFPLIQSTFAHYKFVHLFILGLIFQSIPPGIGIHPEFHIPPGGFRSKPRYATIQSSIKCLKFPILIKKNRRTE